MSNRVFCCLDELVSESGGQAGAERPRVASSPSLSISNNSTEDVPKGWQKIQGSHRRMSFVLAEEIILLGKRFGVERLGFLTLTFADNVQSLKEAQRRFNSLNTHVIRLRYGRAIGVWERQKSGRIHFHLVVVVGSDIRTGFDFTGPDRGDYSSANVALSSEWTFWRATAPRYGFGRHELLPVRSNEEGIARYVGKYIRKHVQQREERDKGGRVVRFIGYTKGERRVSCRFAWNTTNGWLWRQKVKAWCQAREIPDLETLRKRVGPGWAWRLQGEILATRIDGSVVFPSQDATKAASAMQSAYWDAVMQAREILESKTFVRTYLLQPTKRFQPRVAS